MRIKFFVWFTLLFGMTTIDRAIAEPIVATATEDCDKFVYINVPPGPAKEYLDTCMGSMLKSLISSLPPRDLSKLSDAALKARFDLYVERISASKVGRFEVWYLSDLIFEAYTELLRRLPEKRQLFDVIDYSALRRV